MTVIGESEKSDEFRGHLQNQNRHNRQTAWQKRRDSFTHIFLLIEVIEKLR